MGCLGGFRAVTKGELDKLRAVPRKDRVPDYLDEMETADSFDVDKAWDAMHRALTGSRLEFGNAVDDTPPAAGSSWGARSSGGTGRGRRTISLSASPPNRSGRWTAFSRA